MENLLFYFIYIFLIINSEIIQYFFHYTFKKLIKNIVLAIIIDYSIEVKIIFLVIFIYQNRIYFYTFFKQCILYIQQFYIQFNLSCPQHLLIKRTM
ncbi:hypothetical protein IMG5_002280 [Ichthyophthirius multifiliis]|uniref:Transmembrane protein n=1 Tax=Ichthyophthirius multifiliis TaxID=5932 RepID=G0QJ31_ICHMU|nr:hypothetical protein IMG5_002280 [Ichthyophthirius multifiliis]EGR34755.1 hypothetical protein IMG5_002280 [Ichthyophthirius multifiliis]|eukprot:XP_004040059.1 hypothetical protein IMG5_002280 [Ichthyophthirius multifiliis]